MEKNRGFSDRRSKMQLKLVILENKSPVASGINYERYLSMHMQKVNRTHLIVLTISVITAGQVNVNS